MYSCNDGSPSPLLSCYFINGVQFKDLEEKVKEKECLEQELEQEKLQNKENLDDQMANEQKVSNLGAEVLSLEEKVQQLEKELAKSEIMVTDLQQEVESKGIYVYCIHFTYTLYTKQTIFIQATI